MVGPEDGGACPGRKPKSLPTPPEPAGRDGQKQMTTTATATTIRAAGGLGAVQPPGEAEAEEGDEEDDEEEDAEDSEVDSEADGETRPRQLLRRYLAGRLQPGLCSCPRPDDARPPPACSGPGAARRGLPAGMLNGDAGFLRPGRDGADSDPERAGGPRGSRAAPPGPAAEGVAEERADWAAPLEHPLRSCRLDPPDGSPSEGGGSSSSSLSSEDSERTRGHGPDPGEAAGSNVASAPRTPGGVATRNTFEVSRRRCSGDHPDGTPLGAESSPPDAAAAAGPPDAEPGSTGASWRARRSGGLADFLARYTDRPCQCGLLARGGG